MGPARQWISLFIAMSLAIAMLSPPVARAANENLEAMFGAWGKVDDDPQARGCRLYANRADGDYFVLSKGYVQTGGGCVCILEGSSPSDSCFEMSLFCRCDDGMTVQRRNQRFCSTETRSRLDVIEDGETLSYERCRRR